MREETVSAAFARFQAIKPKQPKALPLMTRDSADYAEFEKTFINSSNVMNSGKALAMAKKLHRF